MHWQIIYTNKFADILHMFLEQLPVSVFLHSSTYKSKSIGEKIVTCVCMCPYFRDRRIGIKQQMQTVAFVFYKASKMRFSQSH